MKMATPMEESDPPAAVVMHPVGCELMHIAVDAEPGRCGGPGFVTIKLAVAAGGEDVVVALLAADAEYLMGAIGDALAAARGRRKGRN